jgi:plastocyanin
MKRIFLSIAAATAVISFWACGDGTVNARDGLDDLALLNYGPPFAEGDTGNMWTLKGQALIDCDADPACKAAMDQASGKVEIIESSSSVEAASEESSSSDGPKSSSALIVKMSSIAQVVSNVSSASEESGSTTESSASTIQSSNSISGIALKYCMPKSTTVIKGEPIAWEFKTNGDPATSYQWSFTDADIETSEEASPTTVFTKTGTYTPTLAVNGETKAITCTKVTVVGPDVTGCTCSGPTYTPSSADLKDANPVTAAWEITGCSSVDGFGNAAESFTYTWGTGVSGSGASATGSFTEMGTYSVTATVTNPDGKSALVTCPAASIADNSPFRCNSGNSSTMSYTGSQVEQAVTANSCYAVKLNVSKGYNANLQAGNWSGSAQKIYYTDCKGEKASAELKTGDFSAVNVNYTDGTECTLYMYPAGNFNFVVAMW